MQKVRARRFIFHLSFGCNCDVLFVLLSFRGVVFCFVFGSLHLGFRLGPIRLLVVFHRRLYDRQSFERARQERKKKMLVVNFAP